MGTGVAVVITRACRLPDGRWLDLAGVRGTVVGCAAGWVTLRVWIWGTTIAVPQRVLRRLAAGDEAVA